MVGEDDLSAAAEKYNDFLFFLFTRCSVPLGGKNSKIGQLVALFGVGGMPLCLCWIFIDSHAHQGPRDLGGARVGGGCIDIARGGGSQNRQGLRGGGRWAFKQEK